MTTDILNSLALVGGVLVVFGLILILTHHVQGLDAEWYRRLDMPEDAPAGLRVLAIAVCLMDDEKYPDVVEGERYPVVGDEGDGWDERDDPTGEDEEIRVVDETGVEGVYPRRMFRLEDAK